LESKPLHISQKIEDNLLSLKLKLNFELEGLILSYGENMKVLQPNSLAQKLKERIKKMQKN
jgi:predicted DNA-binding transcriptional regulator YafY